MSKEIKTIPVEVLYEFGTESWSVEEFMAILTRVPEPLRQETFVELEDGVLKIKYHRPETLEEAAERERQEKARIEHAIAEQNRREREMYLRLKQKFEP